MLKLQDQVYTVIHIENKPNEKQSAADPRERNHS